MFGGGGQNLSENNYRFYNNFINSILQRTNRQFFIDVGANDGWFAKTILRFAPNARIFSYEPLLSQHPKLQRLQDKVPNFHFKKVAVGETRGSLTIYEYGTSGLSSIKQISHTYQYSDHYSQSVVNNYSVAVVRLDDEFTELHKEQFISEQDEVVLKIDTQGKKWKCCVAQKATSKIAQANG